MPQGMRCNKTLGKHAWTCKCLEYDALPLGKKQVSRRRTHAAGRMHAHPFGVVYPTRRDLHADTLPTMEKAAHVALSVHTRSRARDLQVEGLCDVSTILFSWPGAMYVRGTVSKIGRAIGSVLNTMHSRVPRHA